MKTRSNEKMYQFKVNDEQEYKYLSEQAKHWCLVNGFVYKQDLNTLNSDLITHLPFTLFPSPFSYDDYEQVYSLQSDINLLVHKIGTNESILENVFENLIKIDEFIRNLWNIYKQAKLQGYNQSIKLTIIRTDYMLHKPRIKPIQNGYLNSHTLDGDMVDTNYKPQMKQVEINTISVGFAVISTKMTELHKKILKWSKNEQLLSKLPENNPLDSVSSAFIEAWKLYNKPKAVVLWIVLENEKNIADQRHLEYAIIDKEPQVEIIRCSFADLHENGYLTNLKELY